MPKDFLLQYGVFVYAAAVIALLVYALIRLNSKSKSTQAGATREEAVIAEETTALPIVSQASMESGVPEPVAWWNDDDFPYSAPWWLRYPTSIGVFAVSYWAFFDLDKSASWIIGVLFAIIGLALVRELFFGAVIAVFAGLALWWVGAAVAALPVSVAIIIGAMIIAQTMRR